MSIQNCAQNVMKEGETPTHISFVIIDVNISKFHHNVNAFQNVGVESEKP